MTESGDGDKINLNADDKVNLKKSGDGDKINLNADDKVISNKDQLESGLPSEVGIDQQTENTANSVTEGWEEIDKIVKQYEKYQAKYKCLLEKCEDIYGMQKKLLENIIRTNPNKNLLELLRVMKFLEEDNGSDTKSIQNKLLEDILKENSNAELSEIIKAIKSMDDDKDFDLHAEEQNDIATTSAGVQSKQCNSIHDEHSIDLLDKEVNKISKAIHLMQKELLDNIAMENPNSDLAVIMKAINLLDEQSGPGSESAYQMQKKILESLIEENPNSDLSHIVKTMNILEEETGQASISLHSIHKKVLENLLKEYPNSDLSEVQNTDPDLHAEAQAEISAPSKLVHSQTSVQDLEQHSLDLIQEDPCSSAQSMYLMQKKLLENIATTENSDNDLSEALKPMNLLDEETDSESDSEKETVKTASSTKLQPIPSVSDHE